MGTANGLPSFCGKQPLFSFGVISDVQYSDIPDGRSFLGVPRYYRHSIVVLQRAVKRWNHLSKLSFAINFGDIVDGFCPKDQSVDAVTRMVNEFNQFNGRVYHMIGNHCLYNLSRSKLLPLLNIPSIDGSAYYDFSPTPEYRFIVLDGYDISAIGWPKDHPKALQVRILQLFSITIFGKKFKKTNFIEGLNTNRLLNLGRGQQKDYFFFYYVSCYVLNYLQILVGIVQVWPVCDASPILRNQFGI